MFTPEERTRLRSEILERAASDARIKGAALTGSAALENEDRWSDIDLAFGVSDDVGLDKILSEWTDWMYAHHSALHHFDVKAGARIYRVFLLTSTLQVDLAFVPASEFRAMAASFRLVFGEAKERQEFPAQTRADLIGFSWLYALHARSCIARGKRWQAEYMISGMRDHALALASLRHGLPAVHGRGFDKLPDTILRGFDSSLVRDLSTPELLRAFQAVTENLLLEIGEADKSLADRLRNALTELTHPPQSKPERGR